MAAPSFPPEPRAGWTICMLFKQDLWISEVKFIEIQLYV